MSRSMDIFVDTDESLEGLVDVVQAILGKSLDHRTNGDDTWYELNDKHVMLSVGRHDFVNDRNMLFEQYPYHIGVRAVGARNEGEGIAWRDGIATQLFAALKAMKQYRLLLVDDVQVQRADYEPASMKRAQR